MTLNVFLLPLGCGSHVDNTEMAVQDVLLQELMSLEPVAFQKVAVDIDSLQLTSKCVAAPGAARVLSVAQPG